MAGFVIVVDMQHDFVRTSGALPVPDAEAIVAPMQNWLESLDPQDVAGVLMSFDTHMSADYVGSPEAELFPSTAKRARWAGKACSILLQ
ncbi:hypothetical protein ACFSLT_21805 [Novosphingobium resinovorum]